MASSSQLLDKLATLERGRDGADGLVYHTEGAAGRDGRDGKAGLKGADGASVYQVEQLVKSMTRQQLEEMLNDIPKQKYDEGVKAVSGGLTMSTDGNEGKEDAQLHQLRWKMQDTQSQLKDLATKLKDASQPASAGSSWDGLGELAMLASKVGPASHSFVPQTWLDLNIPPHLPQSLDERGPGRISETHARSNGEEAPGTYHRPP